jgi:hypothetical protein
MLQAGNPQNFGRFVDELQKGKDLAGALKSVYNTDLNGLAQSYAASLGSAKKPPRKK